MAPANDPDRQHAEEAISAYLPRAVYGLFTLINRLDGLPIAPARRQYLQALLLYACDQANTLWDHPARRERPRQLSTPARFRENNIWLALERGIELWGRPTPPEPLPLTIWPAQPPETGGICLFEGRLKDLAAALPRIPLQAVITALPRPNQAYWTLSALWAGWLWGHEAVGPFKSVLRRRRYDWAWHTTALYAAFRHICGSEGEPAAGAEPPCGLPFFGIIAEAEIGFLTAALTAADAAGFALQSLALHSEGSAAQGLALAQLTWVSAPSSAQPVAEINPALIARQAILEHLSERGEPATSQVLAAAGMAGLARQRTFRLARLAAQQSGSSEPGESEPAAPAELYNLAHGALRDALSYRGGLLRFSGAEKKAEAPPASEEAASRPSEIPEGGLWWLRDSAWTGVSLADQVEMALVNYLLKHPACTQAELETALYQAFPGLLTPPAELIHVCLESYAEAAESDAQQWRLRSEDMPAARSQDLKDARLWLSQLGKKLGWDIKGGESGKQAPTKGKTASPASPGRGSGPKTPVEWCERGALTFFADETPAAERTQYWFYPIASAMISEIILQGAAESAAAGQTASPRPGRGYIVLPGGRANLVAYKLRRDPRLARACESEAPGASQTDEPREGWRFIKFRHLRWLLENPLLSRANLDELLALDPLTYSTPQLRLL